MRILFVISVLSFVALVWATVAIVRHIRRSTGGTAASAPLATAPLASAAMAAGHAHAGMQSLHALPPLMPNRARPATYTSGQRHDRTYASKDSGNLLDPAARASTRPPRRRVKR